MASRGGDCKNPDFQPFELTYQQPKVSVGAVSKQCANAFEVSKQKSGHIHQVSNKANEPSKSFAVIAHDATTKNKIQPLLANSQTRALLAPKRQYTIPRRSRSTASKNASSDSKLGNDKLPMPPAKNDARVTRDIQNSSSNWSSYNSTGTMTRVTEQKKKWSCQCCIRHSDLQQLCV